jgi:hypothetical protein
MEEVSDRPWTRRNCQPPFYKAFSGWRLTKAQILNLSASLGAAKCNSS